MGTYTSLLTRIKAVFDSNTLVQTIVTGDTSEVDQYKKNAFPLVHVNVLPSPFASQNTTGITRYNVMITVVALRNEAEVPTTDKYWLHDNMHSNLDVTRDILKLGENHMIKDIEESGISLTNGGSADPLTFTRGNLLDGWQQQWTIDVPDSLSIC